MRLYLHTSQHTTIRLPLCMWLPAYIAWSGAVIFTAACWLAAQLITATWHATLDRAPQRHG